MPIVVPEFQGEGSSSQAFDQGEQAGSSLMERVQRQQILAKQEQDRSQLDSILLPVKQAQATADIATAHAALGAATTMQNLRTQAAAVADQANKEFLDAQQITDWGDKADALSGLQAKYAWMAQLPQYKGFVNAINDARLQAHQSALLDLHLQNQLEVAKTNADARQEIAQTQADERLQAAGIFSNARVEAAKTAAGRPTAAQKDINYYVDSVASGDTDSANMMEGILQKRAGMSSVEIMNGLGRVADREARLAQQAQNAGDEAAFKDHTARAEALQQRINALSTKSEASAQPASPAGSPPATAMPAPNGKLYSVDPATNAPKFSPSVQTPRQILDATQQMVDDGVITADQARATLQRLGFKPKQK